MKFTKPADYAGGVATYPDGKPMSPTDAGREAKKPEYHLYSDQDFERECINCDKKFTTRLSMNRFCSEECRP